MPRDHILVHVSQDTYEELKRHHHPETYLQHADPNLFRICHLFHDICGQQLQDSHNTAVHEDGGQGRSAERFYLHQSPDHLEL